MFREGSQRRSHFAITKTDKDLARGSKEEKVPDLRSKLCLQWL